MDTTKSDNDTRQLNNIADIYCQLINEPTRITDKSSSFIDLIYTNSPERVVCSHDDFVAVKMCHSPKLRFC